MVRLAALGLVFARGIAAADEVDLNGSWQLTIDCGDATAVVQEHRIIEDVATGSLTMALSVCGTVFFDGEVHQFTGCDPTPIPGQVSGGVYAAPATGLAATHYTMNVTTPALCGGNTIVRIDANGRIDGTVVDDGAGRGIAVDGYLTGDTDAVDANDGICWTAASYSCSYRMLRNDMPPGADVSVSPLEGAAVTFTSVTEPGTVTIMPLTEPVAVPPVNFQLADLPIYYDVTTTAAISGPITVCLPYPDADDDGFVDGTSPAIDEDVLLLLHEEDGLFVNRTVSRDTVANQICAETPSLSQFVFGISTVACGNAVVEMGEDCDAGAGLNGASSSCCTASCAFRGAGETCRPSSGECDGTAETCTGSDGACPADTVVVAGTPCTDDGNVCRLDQCDGYGVCAHPPVGAGAPCPDDGNECRLDQCDGTGACGHPPVAAGTPCTSDGNVCTLDECDGTGTCGFAEPDGIACDDGDECTAGDECTGGVCGGSNLCTVPVAGLKLIVVDKVAAGGNGKVVFVSRDAAIDKGTGTDVAAISARLDILYNGQSASFAMPAGANWRANGASVAKYVNTAAPSDGAVKVGVIKPGQLVKVVGKSLGDVPIDISAAPDSPTSIAYVVTNGSDERRHCTLFSGCAHSIIAGGAGRKLVCRGNGTPDLDCTALP